ncbi:MULTISPECIES: ABC transporter permease [unclassified Streptomyces]|uniref:ABC transporter permease n=1 Tax=unclassified Streptomyces TaxID=2593676 RepID=UPI002E28637A|nr:ABC transporter permease [Streptomyces sp. NBC_00223]
MPELTDNGPVEASAARPAGPADAVRREKARSLAGDAWHDLSRKPMFYIAGLLILFLIVISIWPSVIASGNPLSCNLAKSQMGPTGGHPFGYDTQGCDVYTRTVYGARASVSVGILTTLGATLIGSFLGGLAGFFGGVWDTLISMLSNIFFGIPILLGGVVFLSVVKGGSITTVTTFMVLLGWPQIARIARGAVITAKEQDYVQAARALGAGNARMLLRHIAPNALAPIIVVATIALGTYISLEATLSFLGVGLKPPAVSWGIDISQASNQIRNAPHMLLWPAGALSLTVLAFIMLGDAVRDALDPKLR